jgi:hypothetical protein
VKHFYLNFLHNLFLSKQAQDLHGLIQPPLRDWRILDLLWRAIPPRQPMPTIPTAPLWDYLYVF